MRTIGWQRWSCGLLVSFMVLVNGLEAQSPRGGSAGITRFEIFTIESPIFDGRSFDDVGQYEMIYARAYGEVDPSDQRNAVITDIHLAPRNSNGFVEYSMDVHIIKPVDMTRANGRIIYQINNRGGKSLHVFTAGERGNNPTTAAHAGTGWPMRQGYTFVWSGWEDNRMRPPAGPGDHRVLASLPIARNPDGSSIVEQTIYEHRFEADDGWTVSMVQPGVRNGLKYRAANIDQSQARMLVRNNTRFVGGALIERVEVPKDVWSYVNDSTVYIDRTHPFLAPYDAGAAFEFVYPAIDPIVLGLGFAATRDVISFLRHDASTDNPLGDRIRYAISEGQSQSGRWQRDFIYWGFNEDLGGRKVFEGMMPRIAGSHRIALNARFGDPDATGWSYTRQLLGKMEFPFTYEVRTDPITGRTDGIFARCEVTGTCPNVMQLDTGNEGWLKALNLVTQDGLGNDIELPDNVRAYYFASTQHGMGEPGEAPQFSALCQQIQNPVSDRPHIRALIKALDEWATEGVLPPESRWPRSSDGTFVPSLPQESVGFPKIPGVTYTGWYVPVAAKDSTSLPTRFIPGTEYVVLVPKTDADGNDIAGVRAVEVQVPLATYTGWALRRAPYAENEECGPTGQSIPFPATREEREATGDPRLSIEERYRDYDDYMSRVELAVDDLIRERLVIEEERETLKEAASVMWARLRHPRR